LANENKTGLKNGGMPNAFILDNFSHDIQNIFAVQDTIKKAAIVETSAKQEMNDNDLQTIFPKRQKYNGEIPGGKYVSTDRSRSPSTDHYTHLYPFNFENEK